MSPNTSGARGEPTGPASELLEERAQGVLERGLIDLLEQPLADKSELRATLTSGLGALLVASGCVDSARLLRQRTDFVSAPLPGHLRVVDEAIGGAVGRLCGQSPTEVRWRFARAILQTLPHSQSGFEAAAWAALQSHPPAGPELLATLRARATHFATHPRDLVEIWADDVSYFQRPETHTPPEVAWSRPPHVPMFVIQDSLAFDLLRRSDLSGYLQLLGSLPHREFARQIMDDAGRQADTLTWCDLLRAAPDSSHWGGHVSTTAQLVTMGLTACLERWFPSDPTHPTRALLDTSAVNLEITQVLPAVTARADWPLLGYGWLQQVIARARRAEARSDTANSDRWFSLICSLAATLKPRPDALEWVGQERDGRRNDRVYAVLMVITAQTPTNPQAISDWIEQVLTNALVSSYQIERLATNAQWCDRQVVALAMRSVGFSAPEFNALWSRIFFRRDRSRRLTYRPGSDIAPNVDWVAVFWSLIALGELPSNSPSAQAMWVALEVAIRESRLTEASPSPTDSGCFAVLHLVAHWMHVFPDDPPAGHPGSMEDFLANWASPEADFAYLAAALAAQGVSAAHFIRSDARGELLRAALAQAQRVRGPRLPAPTAVIEKLAEDIDALTS